MESDTAMRLAAFAQVRHLSEIRDRLTASDLKPGFQFRGERIPLINPQRGIFKPTQMRYLLSIKTVFPKPGGRVWYDDQREVHQQIFAGVGTIEYAFMGQDPNAADNRWLREAFENRVPVIYFLGIAPGEGCSRPSREDLGPGAGGEGATNDEIEPDRENKIENVVRAHMDYCVQYLGACGPNGSAARGPGL
jgi:hypothetical protein